MVLFFMPTALQFPLDGEVILTPDSEHYRYMPDDEWWSAIPIGNHLGAYGTKRVYHTHEGVDIYATANSCVYAMGPGYVIDIRPFTGESAGSPWWHDTDCIVVRTTLSTGDTIDILYGEIEVLPGLDLGSEIAAGDQVGNVQPVLKNDKGRPMSMLHLEMYRSYDRELGPEDGTNGLGQPGNNHTFDPTEMLIKSYETSLRSSRRNQLKRVTFVLGHWDESSGRHSGFLNKVIKTTLSKWGIRADEAIITIHNGGNVADLPAVVDSINNQDMLVWFIDVDNSHRKLVNDLKPKTKQLVISKNNRDMTYSDLDFTARMSAANASNLVEFHNNAGEIRYRVWELSPDGNSSIATAHYSASVEQLANEFWVMVNNCGEDQYDE